MPNPRNNNQMISDGGGGTPRGYNYYQQQGEQRRQAQLLAEARARAQQQAAAEAERKRQAQLIAAAQERARQQAAQQAAEQQKRWTALAQQQAGWNEMNMEPSAPTWRSPATTQPTPGLSMEPVAPSWQSPLTQNPPAQPSLQETLSMEPVAPTITYRPHNPFAAQTPNLPQAPWDFSLAYNLPTKAAVSPPAYTKFIQQGGLTNQPYQQQIATKQMFLPLVANGRQQFDPNAQYFGGYWGNAMNRRDAYGNLVPLGPINEYWEFTDVPDNGYYSGGGYGGWGGGGGYNAEDSAPFYRGNYTQSKSRWNETLLTWGLRQE